MSTTRQKLLNTAYEEIHRHGFQGMRVDDVLARSGAAKGSLYHHFRNKEELGYAVVDEIVRGFIESIWVAPLATTERPIDAVLAIIRDKIADFGPGMVELGCPLNNLAQEMSCLDDGFRSRLKALFDDWIESIRAAFARGRAAGNVRADVDPMEVASFIVAAIEGCVGLAKNAQDPATFFRCTRGLTGYLESLRA